MLDKAAYSYQCCASWMITCLDSVVPSSTKMVSPAVRRDW